MKLAPGFAATLLLAGTAGACAETVHASAVQIEAGSPVTRDYRVTEPDFIVVAREPDYVVVAPPPMARVSPVDRSPEWIAMPDGYDRRAFEVDFPKHGLVRR